MNDEVDGNQTRTPALAFHESTPTVDIEALWQRLSEQIERERALFLRLVDDRERLLGISPRTAQLRAFWKRQGSPDLGST